MSEIIKIKRVFRIVEKVVYREKTVKNPNWIEEYAISNASIGTYYKTNPEIKVRLPEMKKVRHSRVNYLIKCTSCENECWVSRIDAKYCSSGCRQDAAKARRVTTIIF